MVLLHVGPDDCGLTSAMADFVMGSAYGHAAWKRARLAAQSEHDAREAACARRRDAASQIAAAVVLQSAARSRAGRRLTAAVALQSFARGRVARGSAAHPWTSPSPSRSQFLQWPPLPPPPSRSPLRATAHLLPGGAARRLRGGGGDPPTVPVFSAYRAVLYRDAAARMEAASLVLHTSPPAPLPSPEPPPPLPPPEPPPPIMTDSRRRSRAATFRQSLGLSSLWRPLSGQRTAKTEAAILLQSAARGSAGRRLFAAYRATQRWCRMADSVRDSPPRFPDQDHPALPVFDAVFAESMGDYNRRKRVVSEQRRQRGERDKPAISAAEAASRASTVHYFMSFDAADAVAIFMPKALADDVGELDAAALYSAAVPVPSPTYFAPCDFAPSPSQLPLPSAVLLRGYDSSLPPPTAAAPSACGLDASNPPALSSHYRRPIATVNSLVRLLTSLADEARSSPEPAPTTPPVPPSPTPSPTSPPSVPPPALSPPPPSARQSLAPDPSLGCSTDPCPAAARHLDASTPPALSSRYRRPIDTVSGPVPLPPSLADEAHASPEAAPEPAVRSMLEPAPAPAPESAPEAPPSEPDEPAWLTAAAAALGFVPRYFVPSSPHPANASSMCGDEPVWLQLDAGRRLAQCPQVGPPVANPAMVASAPAACAPPLPPSSVPTAPARRQHSRRKKRYGATPPNTIQDFPT